jgi:hypothetical protein
LITKNWEWHYVGWWKIFTRLPFPQEVQKRPGSIPHIVHIARSVADSDPFDTDPAFHFDTDPDLQFDPDPAVWYGSGSLPFQRGNVTKTVLFTHLYLIFLVSRVQ